MSAFQCTDEHISALAGFAADVCRVTPGDCDPIREQACHAIGRILHAANVASLQARYPKDGPAPAFRLNEHARCAAAIAPAVRIIKAAQCFEYQACEYEGWANSEACRIIKVVVDQAVRRIPGFDAAPWGCPVDPPGKGSSGLVSLSSMARGGQ